jgi:hypothetical protein
MTTGEPIPPDLADLARRTIWFEPPMEALSDRRRFLAYLMTYCTPEDIAVARRHFSQADFRDALDHAPPGIFDERSWAYWNLVMGRFPAPPLPKRVLPE